MCVCAPPHTPLLLLGRARARSVSLCSVLYVYAPRVLGEQVFVGRIVRL